MSGEEAGWAAINFPSYICMQRRPGTQSLRANYGGDLDSTRPAPELGTIKPTIRERKQPCCVQFIKPQRGLSGN